MGIRSPNPPGFCVSLADEAGVKPNGGSQGDTARLAKTCPTPSCVVYLELTGWEASGRPCDGRP